MCALPKGFRKNIKIINDKVGVARRQEILDDIDKKGTYLPRGVMYEDMDKSFIKFVEDDLEIVIDGEKVPVIFLTLQRWSEFSKTWQHADKYKDIKMPFITIVRQPNPQVGKNQAGLFNIPGRRTYTYMKVPTFDGGRRGVDLYKIPQPTSVDITYEVRLFCNRMRDLNRINVKIQHTFNAIQYYIKVNGHPMPLLLENIGDESNIDDFENRRFYVQPFEIRLQGYVLDEDKFEVIPAINRALVMSEITDTPIVPKFTTNVNKSEGSVFHNIIFKARSESNFTFVSDFDLKYTDISNVEGATNIILKVNGIEKLNGLTIGSNIIISAGDTIYIKVSRDFYTAAKFTLIGKII
tara:strand:+ start:45879 stop:46934 length:1056 start_codon:yes stop_codon:yes gene_type:complete